MAVYCLRGAAIQCRCCSRRTMDVRLLYFSVYRRSQSRLRVSYRKTSLLGRVLFLTASGIILGNIVITALFTRASVSNYPGGQALSEFHRTYAAKETTRQFCLIHIFIPIPDLVITSLFRPSARPHLQPRCPNRRFSLPATQFAALLFFIVRRCIPTLDV
jgi:hypothetical protein